MKLSYGLTIEQTQKLTMTPELIQAIRILQFKTQELDEFVQEELLENPVLEFENKYKSEKTLDIREKFMEDYGDGRYEQWENPGGSDKEEFSYVYAGDVPLGTGQEENFLIQHKNRPLFAGNDS